MDRQQAERITHHPKTTNIASNFKFEVDGGNTFNIGSLTIGS